MVKQAAVDDRRATVPAVHAEEHMAVDVGIAEGGEGFIVHDDHVRRGAFLQDAEGHAEVLLRNEAVVGELHGHVLAPGDVRQGGVMALDDEEDLHAFQHIVGIGVGAHADGDALLHHLQHGGAAHGVAHVGFRIVDHHGSGFPDDVHFGWADVDAVAQEGFGSQDAVIQQAVHRAAAIVPEAVVDVVHAFRHVDMEAGHAVVGLHHFLEGFVGNRKEGVAAEHGFDHGIVGLAGPVREVGVFPDALAGFFLAVPLGDLVTEAGPDAGLLRHVANRKEGARDFAEGGVMVEDGGHAVADAVEDRSPGGSPGAGQGQVAVDVPPHAFEDFQKVGGIMAFDGKAPGQAGIDMGMGVDEAGHDDAARRVDELRIRVGLFQGGFLADGKNFGAVRDDRAVGEVGVFRVPGDDPAVSDQKHVCTSLFGD